MAAALAVMVAAPAEAASVGVFDFIGRTDDGVVTMHEGPTPGPCGGFAAATFNVLGENPKLSWPGGKNLQYRLRLRITADCIEEPLKLDFTEAQKCRFASGVFLLQNTGMFIGCQITASTPHGLRSYDVWVPMLTGAYSVLWVTWTDADGGRTSLNAWMTGTGFNGWSDAPVEPIEAIAPPLPRVGEIVAEQQL